MLVLMRTAGSLPWRGGLTKTERRYATAQIPYPRARVPGRKPRQCPEMDRTAYPEGKTRVALNALRHGLKAGSFFSHFAKSRRASEEVNGLYRALYAVLLPNETGIDLLKQTVLQVWL